MTPDHSSFMFIGNLLDVQFPLPLEVLPGRVLDRATLAEAAMIHDYLDRRPVNPLTYPWARYEIDYTAEPQQDGSTRFNPRALPPSQYRYYVIRYSGSNRDSDRLSQAAAIADPELTFPVEFVLIGGGSGWVSHPVLYQNYYMSIEPPPRDIVSTEQLSQIGSIYEGMVAIEAEFPDVLRAIEMFASLRLLQPASEFQILGMFAIIESLLTHDPTSAETGDSLTRQVSKKLPLLARRFQSPILYETYFGNAGADTIWKRLYEYRSALAHGKQPDFEERLRILVDAANARTFLRSATKALLRHALKEPRLVTDLREC